MSEISLKALLQRDRFGLAKLSTQRLEFLEMLVLEAVKPLVVLEALMVVKDVFLMNFLLLFIPLINSKSLYNLVFGATDSQNTDFGEQLALVTFRSMLIGLTGFGLESTILLLDYDFLVLFELPFET